MKKIVLTMVLLCFIASVSASSAVTDYEKTFGDAFGFTMDLVEGHEADMIIRGAANYFMPSKSAQYLLDTAKIIADELHKYDQKKLRELGLRVYVVEPKTKTTVGNALVSIDSTGKKTCDVYIVKNPGTKMTVHHEVFHCIDIFAYDVHRDWAARYNISDTVAQRWDGESSHDPAELFGGEERAEYYAALIVNNFSDFDGSVRGVAADVQMEAKKAEMQLYVDAYLKKDDLWLQDADDIIKIWKDGRIHEIRFLQQGQPLGVFIIDHVNQVCIIRRPNRDDVVQAL